jgi:chromosome partitioning protein
MGNKTMIKEIVAAVNRKGGAGKTTTSQSLSEGLKLKGYKVLFIDMDGQGNLSNTLKADKAKPTIFDILTRRENIRNVLQHTPQSDIIASDASLFAADIRIIDTGKEYRLKEVVDAIIEEYAYIIMDTPPCFRNTHYKRSLCSPEHYYPHSSGMLLVCRVFNK